MLKELKGRMEDFSPAPRAVWGVRSDALAIRAALQGRSLARRRDEAISTAGDLADVCDSFYRLQMGLIRDLKAKGYTQIATFWDVATVGSLALHDLVDGRWQRLKDLAASAFSEASMVMASIQYIKAAEEKLLSLTDEHISFLYGRLWSVVPVLRKGLRAKEVGEVQEGLDSFFNALSSEEVGIEQRLVVVIGLYMLLVKLLAERLLSLVDERDLGLA